MDFGLLAVSDLGLAYALSGRLAEAFPLAEEAFEKVHSTGLMNLKAGAHSRLGEIHLRAGCLDSALAHARQALEYAQQHTERAQEAGALHLQGEIAAQGIPPDIEQAEESFHQALTLAEELGMRPLQAHCHLGLGTLYSRVERLEEARAALSTAIHMYRTMEMSLWLPQAEATLAQIGERLQRQA
jgi:tetratricopeptide (TPR) repeat protein